MHGTCYAPIGQEFAFYRVFLECHEKLVNRMAHTDRRQFSMIVGNSFDTTKLNKGEK